VGTILGISIVLIPVIGLTARFALKPVVEALGKVFEQRGTSDVVAVLERRIELQEHEIEALKGSVERLAEVSEFDKALKAPGAAADARSLPSMDDPQASRAAGEG
jgi:hypothetical protein